MEVKCHDCKKMVPEGKAIRKTESEGYAGGGSHKGTGGGSYRGESTGYWLCYRCHKKRENFNTLMWCVITVILIIVGIIIYYKYFKS